MIEHIFKGGIMMYPLLLSSIIILAIIIERCIYFHHAEVDEHALYQKVKENLLTNGNESAVAYCEKMGGPIATTIKAGIQQAGQGREKIEDAFERESLVEIPNLKKYLATLNTLGSISTLLGFTGTVLGMIKAFNSIALAGTTSPGIVAGGIAEALTSTAAGLIIAIVALLAYYSFSFRVEKILLELEKISRDLIEILEG